MMGFAKVTKWMSIETIVSIGVGKVIAAENNRSILSTVKGMMSDKVREGDQVTTKL